jgi:dienelactone hydrolase
MSLGGMPAQRLAQTQPGAKGLVLLHTAIPLGEFGDSWPDGVPLQIHTMADDDWGDADVGRELADAVPNGELFLYPGDVHLFTDNSLPDYDEGAATLVKERVLSFLEKIA